MPKLVNCLRLAQMHMTAVVERLSVVHNARELEPLVRLREEIDSICLEIRFMQSVLGEITNVYEDEEE